MAISSPGIGSGLDVNSIVSKLMDVESQPLAAFDKKTQSFTAKISAYGSLSGALASFQGSLSALSSKDAFLSTSATSTNTDILSGSATSGTTPGTYKINVTQVAQAQTLTSGGRTSSTASIGAGISTRVSFQLGTVSGGNYGLTGSTLALGVAGGGIATGALSINGTTIATDGSTRSAKLLADAINAKTGSTNVTAGVTTATSSATLFGANGSTTFGHVDTSGGGTYALAVNGITLLSQAAGIAPADPGSVGPQELDTILAGSNSITDALAQANITFTGHAADGTLQFTSADGANLSIVETVSGSVAGGIAHDIFDPNAGSSVTTTAGISLVSSNGTPITVGGNNPALAGLTAGTGGQYLGASFAQDGSQISGSVVIDSTNNSLQGIRDAINKANLGVTASIISDGSATPNHLVLTSSRTGASSTMKITLAGTGGGAGDPALESLLGYDPAGTQNLNQTTAAQSTLLTVNGIQIQSNTTTVSGAIPGATFSVAKTGAANLVVAQDTGAVKNNVSTFVKAYNDLNKAIHDLSAYDPETKKGGPLLGDSTIQTLQASVRKQLTGSITGLSGSLTSLSQVGIAFQKDGSMTSDSAKLNKAISGNLSDIAGLFSALGSSTDNLVTFGTAGSKTQPGKYALNVTQLAQQGSLTSTAALAGPVVVAADTSWTVRLNDTVPADSANSAIVSIPAGSYTASDFAVALQSAINGASNFSSTGKTVSASIDGNGKLVLSSSRYGSVSKIDLSSYSGTSVEDVFGGATPVAGLDVAGTLGGDAFVGSGQTATGAAGSDMDGLKIDITGGALGDRGTVNFSQGYAHQLSSLAANFLDSDGLIANKKDGLNASIKDIAKQKDAFSLKLVDIEKRYRAQYTALDTAVASLNSTASFLTQQFAALAKSTS